MIARLSGSLTCDTRPLASYVTVLTLLNRSCASFIRPRLSNTILLESANTLVHPDAPVGVPRISRANSPSGEMNGSTPDDFWKNTELPSPVVKRADPSVA